LVPFAVGDGVGKRGIGARDPGPRSARGWYSFADVGQKECVGRSDVYGVRVSRGACVPANCKRRLSKGKTYGFQECMSSARHHGVGGLGARKLMRQESNISF